MMTQHTDMQPHLEHVKSDATDVMHDAPMVTGYLIAAPFNVTYYITAPFGKITSLNL